MDMDPELKQKIEAAMAAVTDKRSANMKIHLFLLRINQYSAQLLKDKDKLIGAKYDWEKYAFFLGLVTYLTQVHADRIAAEGKGARQVFGAKMKKIKMYCTILILVTEHVIDRTGDEAVKAALKKIREGTTNLDTLVDLLALASLLREYLDIAKEFTPEEIEVNDAYLDMITAEAEGLLTLAGKPKTETGERAALVDKQERLITVCMDEIDDIKKFGKGAFCLHMDYYNKHYPLHRVKDGNSNSTENDTDVPDETETEGTETTEE